MIFIYSFCLTISVCLLVYFLNLEYKRREERDRRLVESIECIASNLEFYSTVDID